MTDVRDRAPETALKLNDGEPVKRQSLVLRALAPVRRNKQNELTPDLGNDFQIADVAAPRTQRKYLPLLLSFVALVIVPAIAAGVYLFAFAANQYVAEARFAVRKSSAASASVSTFTPQVTSSPLMGSGFRLAGEEAEIIASYIHSNSVIADVSRTVDIRAIFDRPEADFWARLPRDASAEQLLIYWDKMVSVYVESTSGIIRVSVSAFRRQDALTLTQAILKASEDLANRMTLKIRADEMKVAEGEVLRSEGEVRFALADLTSFRNAQHLIDPVTSSESTGKLLMQLMSDKIETEGKLFVAQRVQGPNAPGLAAVKARLDSINQHITELQNQLAGNKLVSKNMAATMARFEELQLKKEFAERMYGFARDGVERARVSAERQAIYLAVFEPPELPQDFSYPLRWTDFILITVVGAMIWVCCVTVTASILDHRL